MSELVSTKPALASKGVWGGIISGAMSLVVGYFSLDLSPDAQNVIKDLSLLIISAVSGGGSILSIVGRIFAKIKIAA